MIGQVLSSRWKLLALLSATAIAVAVPIYVLRDGSGGRAGEPRGSQPPATFVGRSACYECHREAYEAWVGSDHDNAMAPASDRSVRGDFADAAFTYGDISARFYKRDGRFYVHTQGPDGRLDEFEVAYTFGWEPLQQYLIPFPGGRLQALTIAWDTEEEEWFYLYPGQDIPADDWLHWTGGAQNWNGMCAECHSTNLVKGYDFETRTFSTTWSEIDVSCEACHGPASRHVEWAQTPSTARPEADNYELAVRTRDIGARELVELCAPCHSRRTELGDYDHTRPHLLDNITPVLLEEGLYFADGQILEEVYVYGSFVQSEMFRMGVRCSDCHDSHSLELHREGNGLCTGCHRAESYDSYDHHFHRRVHESKPSDGQLCVKCHMPERPYMVVDWRADHSLRVPRPDLTLEIGVPNACGQSGCHDDRPAEWLARAYRRWYGPPRKPHYGTVLAAGRALDPAALDRLARLAGDDIYPPIVRATALRLLGDYPGDARMPAFSRALSDSEALVRHTAVGHLTTEDPERLAELLTPLLFDPVRAVRTLAASRLAGMPGESLEPNERQALEESLKEYIDATEYSLDFAFAGYNLGNLYARLGDVERAAVYYGAAIQIDDLFYPAKVNLAVIRNSQGRNEEAERLLREVVEDLPEQYDAAYSLGLLLAELGRYEGAVTLLRRAAEGLADRGRVHYNLGLVEQYLGNSDAAEAALTRSVEIEPDNLDFLFALADHLVGSGELDRARMIAERMIDAHPESPLGREVIARIESLQSARPPN